MGEAEIRERLGALDAKVTAAHKRLDKHEQDVKESLNEIKESLKELNAHMNKGKGMAALIVLLAGSTGAGIMKLLTMVIGGN
jgi:SUMO ligase MMS21 Smc5/6 complex component